MKISQLELSVGGFVVAGLLAVAYIAVKVGGGSLVAPATYSINARFTYSGGLAEGSSVLISGVPVGRVRRVRLDHGFAAIVEMQLYKNIRLPNDTIASIKTAGLIGDKFVSLSPGSDTEMISAGGTIVETESVVDLESLISRFAFGSVQGNVANSAK